jgi:deazaflavin-dependent oxidoreductase (nitroreductase family)
MKTFSQDQIQLPKGLLRLGFKLPVWFYRLRFGWMMGKRFVYVEHIGHKSGKVRRSVLEVIRHDVQNDHYLVASAYGTRSSWYKNIHKNREVFIQVGTRRTKADALFLSVEESQAELLDYAQTHPSAVRFLAQMVGFPAVETDEDLEAFSKLFPIIAFAPK